MARARVTVAGAVSIGASTVAVSLAGAVSVQHGNQRAGHQQFRGRQLPLVTAILVLRRDRPIPVEFLAEQLWPDQPLPQRWRVAVRGLVSQFRHVLADLGLDHDDLVVADAGTYRVQLPDTTVDLEAVPDHLQIARDMLDQHQLTAARDHASAARAITSRPVLSGIEAPWLTDLRTDLLHHRLEALDLLSACRSRAGEHADAVAVAQEAIGLDPFRESAWRRLLQAHADAGNPAAAMRAYEQCRDLLTEELGVPPSADTQALYVELLRSIPDEGLVLSPGSDTAVAPVVGDRTPYRGLLAFDTDDADVFFGRDAHVQELLDRLADHPAIVVTGPSGSGKSSLVRAGLLPALTHGALPDSDTWVTTVVVPGAEPLEALARALESVVGPDTIDLADALTRLRDDPTEMRRLTRQVLASRGAAPSARLLVLVDQAEELFTVCPDAGARQQFVRALLDAARGPTAPMRVVLTLRADFYADAAALPELADLLSTSQYVLPPLDGDGLEAAIIGPARLVGATLEDGLVGRILGDVVGEPGFLPLLQHALLELWERRADHVLTQSSYDDIGGVPGALTNRAEVVFRALSPGEQAVARRLLLRGVQPGLGTGDARRRVLLTELEHADGQGEVEEVVDRFVDARLLTGAADVMTGEPTARQLTPEECERFELGDGCGVPPEGAPWGHTRRLTARLRLQRTVAGSHPMVPQGDRTMTTAPTTAPPRSRRSLLAFAVPIVLAIVATALLLLSLLASPSTQAEDIPPATSNQQDRGAGDPCTERFETGGGFLEGLDPANRCGPPAGTPRVGGRIE